MLREQVDAGPIKQNQLLRNTGERTYPLRNAAAVVGPCGAPIPKQTYLSRPQIGVVVRKLGEALIRRLLFLEIPREDRRAVVASEAPRQATSEP